MIGPQCFGWKVVYSYLGTVTHGFKVSTKRMRRSVGFPAGDNDRAIEHYRAVVASEYQFPYLAVTLYEKTKPSGGWRRCRRYRATALIEAMQANG